MTDVLVILLILGWGVAFWALAQFCDLAKR
jgi:hypothetical protein